MGKKNRRNKKEKEKNLQNPQRIEFNSRPWITKTRLHGNGEDKLKSSGMMYTMVGRFINELRGLFKLKC